MLFVSKDMMYTLLYLSAFIIATGSHPADYGNSQLGSLFTGSSVPQSGKNYADGIIPAMPRKLQSYERAPFARFLPPKTREDVRLETESGQSLFERRNPKYINGLLQNVVRAEPVVDHTHDERDKFGNIGDTFGSVPKTLVTGVEGLGNLLDKIARFPVGPFQPAATKVTEALNQIGSKLVGLQ